MQGCFLSHIPLRPRQRLGAVYKLMNVDTHLQCGIDRANLGVCACEMQERIKAIFLLRQSCELETPFLRRPAGTPCDANTKRIERSKARNTGD